MIKFIKPLSIYASSNLFSKGISFLLLITLSHFLTPYEQGLYSLFTVYVGILFPILHIGIISASQVEYFKMGRKDFGKYITSSLSLSFIIFFAILLIVFIFRNSLSNLSKIPPYWLLLIPLVAFFRIIASLFSAIYRSMEEAVKYTIFNISMSSSYAFFTLFFVIAFNLTWEGRVLGIAVPGIIFFLVGLSILYKKELVAAPGEIKKEYQRSALSFGVPLIPHLLAVILIDTSDKLFIANKIGVDEVGIYNMGYKFGALILLLQNIFMNVWNPFLYKRLDNNDISIKKEIVKQAYFFFGLILLSVVLITFISPFFFNNFIGEQYKSGIKFVLWVALGYSFYSMFNMLSSIILFFKKTVVLSYMSAANVLLNLALNYYLIDIYGTMGAAYATFISFFITFFLIFIYMHSIVRLPWFSISIFSKNNTGRS